MIRLVHINDTNRAVLALFQRGEALASSDVHERLESAMSLVTAKRALSDLYELGYLEREGAYVGFFNGGANFLRNYIHDSGSGIGL